ncbi:transcription-repair coupling factor [Putridiphycobacter roseus]|uniref:Transcription-repair-coupling factor n=1 Tax=Putridiphycobacter roseus TaxID=2219161 RepID=A0A2W1NEX1_9FLAO|nr:transcription-repair coupling factor [Putridiphycobacter roseus]PZE16606.1 transcription-repair coupling factor [Putridiphycobacter roseus]
MNGKEFKNLVAESPQITALTDLISKGKNKISLKGSHGAFTSTFMESAIQKLGGNHLIILADKEEAAYFLNDIQSLTDHAPNVLFLPHSYKKPYQFEAIDNANVVARAEVLAYINAKKNGVIITYPEALVEKVMTKKQFAKTILEIKKGGEYSISFINELLIQYEFEKVDFIYEPGQFAVRGGIVDVFSYSNDQPYRIEFFGDEVDSIRTFDPTNQLSIATHTRLTVVPNIQTQIKSEARATILEFLGPETVIWCKDYLFTKGIVEQQYQAALDIFNALPDSPVPATPPVELYYEKSVFDAQFKAQTLIEFGSQTNYYEETIHFNIKQQPSFNKNFDLLIEHFNELEKNNYKIQIVSNQPKQIERIYSIFEDLGADSTFTTLNYSFHEGFINHDLKIACYTDHQIFERYHRFKLKDGFRKNQQALTLKEIYNLNRGDFVAHIDHGIGQFSGLEIIDVNGKPQEAIRLIYRDNDVLYVSVHSLHRISKYTGKDGTQPKMNKIGSPQWDKVKKKTKARVKEIAFNLIKLYAQRKAEKGFAFAPDNYLQNELEASFIYEDTPDQLKATVDVKADMESETPMDRLVCGDVGFGKTEIAIRAAFKAVCDNKQVAVLVPTTILSLQHFKTFKERLKDFPCEVDYINRFKTTKQVNESLKRLAAGETDIIIGTHKLVGKQVKYKDLGLIIIDEEQKFGVGVKDKLKTIKTTVDTLTLTATPIPRTLQFSLMGARDLSIINTPPPNRQPVETHVVGFNETAIRDAVAYETNRGGQVFFVHNRVQNIHEVAGMIQRLCPGIRVAVGHGQMDGAKLENIMMDFINHEYDVLVATTIIESGIDVSNANTIMINQAQNFGLSDLHQMRGRVGRSNKKAFCYLIAPPMHTLPNDSRKRLEALVHFSDLGSGFNISMRDLDIRGAGNLLGGEQSGFISDIGFEMYQKILKEAVQELREEEFKDLYEEDPNVDGQEFVTDCILETDLALLIPDTYVNNVSERLALYQSLDNCNNAEELSNFTNQLKDRFGALPNVVKELCKSIEMRWLAKSIGFEKLVIKSKKMIGYFVAKQDSPYYQSPQFTKVLQFIQSNPKNCKMNEKNNRLRLVYNDINSIEKALHELEKI